MSVNSNRVARSVAHEARTAVDVGELGWRARRVVSLCDDGAECVGRVEGRDGFGWDGDAADAQGEKEGE